MVERRTVAPDAGVAPAGDRGSVAVAEADVGAVPEPRPAGAWAADSESGPILTILAAGASRRYGRLKQLDPVGPSGEALLDYAIWDALRAGFRRIVLVIRPDLEPRFRSHLGNRWRGVDVDYAHQTLTAGLPDHVPAPAMRIRPWGTAHAVLCAEPFLHGAFAVVNADDFYGAGAYTLAAAHLQANTRDGKTMALIAYPLATTLSPHGGVSRAVCDVRGVHVRHIVELVDVHADGGIVTGREESGLVRALPPDTPASMNFWVLRSALLPFLHTGFHTFLKHHGHSVDAEFRLSTEVDTLLRAGAIRLRALSNGTTWMGVTYAEDGPKVRARITRLVADGVYPRVLGTAALERLG